MATETAQPKITVHLRLAKFDGEYVPGATPVEIVERDYDFTDDKILQQFLKETQNGND